MTLPKARHDAVVCGGCGTPVPLLPRTGLKWLRCAGCDGELLVETFPALFRGRRASSSGELLGTDGESGCFYHERKKAVAVCEECGRFLCSLCEVRLGGRVLCPGCIERGREAESLEALVTRRTLYDGMALSLAVLPLLLFFVTLFTAPLSLYFAIRFWNRPGSILPRTRIRFVLAILISLLQLAGWGFVFMEMARHA